RDGPVAGPWLRRLPEAGGDLPAGALERLLPRAEVPRPELPDRQLVADGARVERVDPGVVAARTLRVIEDGVVPLVDRSEDLPALRRVLRLEVLEEELRRELEARRAVVAHALVVQQRAVDVRAVELEALAQCRGVLEGLRGTLAEGRQHRVSGVPDQAHATLRPVLERVPVVEPPLRRVLDQARECDDVVVTGVALERLAHVSDHLI